MDILELGDSYDIECEYVDYKGNCYPLTIKKLTYVQIEWLLVINAKQNNLLDKSQQSDDRFVTDMDAYCDYTDVNNVNECKRLVKYVDSWCFKQEPSVDNIVSLYAQRDDVALGVINAMLTRYHEVMSGARKAVVEVKKK